MNSVPFPPIPADTANAARAVFGRDHFYLVIGDRANKLFSGLTLKDSAEWVRKPTNLPAIYYLVTIFQFMETLPDNLAEEAIRRRVDWKYALHLPLNYVDLKAAKLCEFRKYLLGDTEGKQILQALLSRLSEVIVVTGKQHLNHEALYVIQNVCLSSRLAMVWVAARDALGVLATKQPQWLREISLPHWYDTFGQQQMSLNRSRENAEPEAFAQGIANDGVYLLEAISASGVEELLSLSEVFILKRVLQDQFEQVDGKLLWRKEACSSCSLPGIFIKAVKTVDQTDRRWK